jgi:hypothetical protein
VKAAVLEIDADEWRTIAVGVIAQFAELRRPFTSSEVRLLLPEPHHPNALGGAFTAAKAAGLIIRTGHTTSTTRSRHHGTQAVWIGTERRHREPASI